MRLSVAAGSMGWVAAFVSAGLASWIALPRDEFKSGIDWPEPPVVTPGDANAPPSDAIVLFDGSDMGAFENGEKWKVENGYAEVRGGSVRTRQSFGDCQLHLEFATPEEVKGEGQGRGNSGVYLMDRYEVQILDSYVNTTYFDGQCAAVYKQQPPIVNACRKPGEWQTYDIIFRAPRFAADGAVLRPASVTVLQNGILVQNHFELAGGTYYDQAPSYSPHEEKLPISIQDHGNPMRFRNIWIRENVQPLAGKMPELKPEAAPAPPAPPAEPAEPAEPAGDSVVAGGGVAGPAVPAAVFSPACTEFASQCPPGGATRRVWVVRSNRPVRAANQNCPSVSGWELRRCGPLDRWNR